MACLPSWQAAPSGLVGSVIGQPRNLPATLIATMEITLLPTPTVELVQAACDAFDEDDKRKEEALRLLWAQFPHNTETSHVLLKVLVLNKLYSTRILDKDVEPLSEHIVTLNIDPLLDRGDLTAVERIYICPPLKMYYSFATKLCSWHNPTAYPIYDHNADECLWSYQKQDGFANFRRQDLGYYEKFVAIVTAFRNHYGLISFNFRQVDKFLVRSGDEILRTAESRAGNP